MTFSKPHTGPGHNHEAFMNGMLAEQMLSIGNETTEIPAKVTNTVEKYKGLYTDACIPEEERLVA